MGNNTIDNYEFGELEINDITVSHLHDKNGENWFDDNAGALLLGTSLRNYQDHVKNVLDSSESLRANSAKTLKTNKTGRPKRFVNFTIINIVAGRIKSYKAIRIVGLAGELLNEKYNQVQGYTEIPEPNHIDVIKLENKQNDLKSIRKDDVELISRLNHRAKRLEQNGDIEELERTRETLLDVSNEFTEISLLISDITELTKSAKTVTKLSPKVTGNKYFNQNYLVPFKKS